jgi:putative glutamine amidotransferase
MGRRGAGVMRVAISPFGNGCYGNLVSKPFDKIFNQAYNPVLSSISQVKDADALLLWGGEDIHPSFYREKPHPFNDTKTPEPSYRDMLEWRMLQEAVEHDVPIIGVCRGAQLLCAFAGGSLIQHVSGNFHKHGHEIETYDGLSIFAKANHHQMMMPDNTKHDLLAWVENKSEGYGGESGKDVTTGMYVEKKIDPEVVYFSDVNGIAIQPHPEWHEDSKDPFCTWILQQLDYFFFK